MKLLLPVALVLQPTAIRIISSRNNVKIDWQILTWFLVGSGILLRLYHYLDNRSLWLDEIYLSSSLIKMNFWELMAPMLDYEQKAPVGFLWLVRLCVLALGKNQMALRLIPLLSGLAALALFVPVARYFLKPLGVVLAIGLLALAPPLVYHAVEIKQYSTEMLAAILALYCFTRYHQRLDFKSLLFWGLAGALLIWFSFSSIFILAGLGIGSSLYYLRQQNWVALVRSAFPFSLWLGSFVVHFFLFTYNHISSGWLIDWFQQHEAFMPLAPTTLAEFKWLLQMPYRFLHYPMGLLWFSPTVSDSLLLRNVFRLTPFFLVLFAAGLFRFYRQDAKWFYVLTLPLLLTLIASSLKVYPFYERLLVFLAPMAILVIAGGCETLSHLFFGQTKMRYLLPALLVAGPLVNALLQVINPELMDQDKSAGIVKQHHREVFLYINQHFRPGDAVYIYWNDLPPYRFYREILNLKYQAIEGSDVRFVSKNTKDYFKNLRQDFKALAGKKRVWLVYDRLLMVNIGDYLNRPSWYCQANLKQPGKMLIHNQFATMGPETNTYLTPYLAVGLFKLNNQ